MKTVSHFTCRAWLVPTVSLALLWCESPSHAQAYRNNEFQRQGDAFSEKVSGFFGRVFGGGSPNQQAPAPVYQQTPAGGYGQHSAAAPQQPRYRQAPPTGSSQSVAPQRSYTQAPATKAPARSSAPTATKKTSRSTVASQPRSSTTKRAPAQSESRAPVYTSTKRSKEESTPAPARKSTQETVVSAPPPPPAPKNEEPAKTYTSLNSNVTSKTENTDIYPLPGKSGASSPTKESTSSTSGTGSSSSAQEFPTGKATGKPGRVVSPYEPHNELDVQGLPPGSLALDPTTQKVFKIP